MREVTGWILEENVRPLIDILGDMANYNLDEGEWDYIRHGLDKTDSDAEPPNWMEYEFAGESSIELRIARDGGSNVLLTELGVPNHLSDRIQLVLNLLSTYHLALD